MYKKKKISLKINCCIPRSNTRFPLQSCVVDCVDAASHLVALWQAVCTPSAVKTSRISLSAPWPLHHSPPPPCLLCSCSFKNQAAEVITEKKKKKKKSPLCLNSYWLHHVANEWIKPYFLQTSVCKTFLWTIDGRNRVWRYLAEVLEAK